MKTLAIRSAVLSVTCALSAWAAAPQVGFGKAARVARSPATQAGVNNGQSSFTSPVLQLGAGKNRVTFTWGVESQVGDVLELHWVDANAVQTLLWSVSGLKGGTVTVALPTAAGSGKLRFFYKKNASGNQYLDGAWVDEVVVQSATGAVTRFGFDEGTTGWVTGSSGFAGAWSSQPARQPMAASRPAAQNGVIGKSAIERSVIFPTITENAIGFEYLVDGNTADALNVYLDPASNPTPLWSISGANKRGHASISSRNGQPLPGGPHIVRFEYAKLTTGGQSDTARVDDVQFMSNGAVFEEHRFDGREPGVTPIHVGTNAAEWTGSGLGGGWVVQPTLPHQTWVPTQQPGVAYQPGWTPFTVPVVDGMLHAVEYKTATTFPVATPGTGNPATVSMSKTSNTLHVAMRVKAGTAALGDENGKLTLMLNASQQRALGGLGCGVGVQLPEAEDRKITVSWSMTPGTAVATIAPVTQQKGNCASWVALSGTDAPWPISVAVGESSVAPGLVNVELAITLPASVVSDEMLGLAMVRTNLTGTPSSERLPYRDAAGAASNTDVLTWETVRFDALEKRPYSDASFDGCCFPVDAMPDRDW